MNEKEKNIKLVSSGIITKEEYKKRTKMEHSGMQRQKRDMLEFEGYLNRLRKKNKEYLIAYIEGMLTSGRIRVK